MDQLKQGSFVLNKATIEMCIITMNSGMIACDVTKQSHIQSNFVSNEIASSFLLPMTRHFILAKSETKRNFVKKQYYGQEYSNCRKQRYRSEFGC